MFFGLLSQQVHSTDMQARHVITHCRHEFIVLQIVLSMNGVPDSIHARREPRMVQVLWNVLQSSLGAKDYQVR